MSSTLPDLVTFTIRIDGKELGRDYEITGIYVRKEANRIASAKLVLLDGDPSQQNFPHSEEEQFSPEAEIEIDAGYHSQEKPLFKGIIIRTRISAKARGASQLTLDCKDAANKLTRGRKNACFYEQTDDAVIAQLLKEASVKGKAEKTSVKHAELVQYHVTDWDFIVSRAEANGQLVLVNDGQLDVKKPSLEGDAKAKFEYGVNILEIDVQQDGATVYKKALAESWDPATQAVVSKPSAETPKGSGERAMRHAGPLAEEELQAWADAAAARSQLAKNRGCVRVQGTPDVVPGDLVELSGLGKRFSETVFVSGVSHQISQGEWLTDIQFGLADDWFSHRARMADAPAAGLLPSAGGLQIGTVAAIDPDPKEEFRVQVKLPLVDGQADGLWARVARLDAGPQRGTVFLPEVDDEVVLGFMNDDPRSPVILGMLHSSKNPPPLEAAENNPQKGIVSRENIKMLFDDEKKSLEFSTPEGNTIRLDEDQKSLTITDQNDNAVEMTADGINIRDKNRNVIKLTSDGVTIESGKDLVLKATGNVKIEGMNVETAANGQFKAAGNAGAELSTSAIAVLKGSLVKIN